MVTLLNRTCSVSLLNLNKEKNIGENHLNWFFFLDASVRLLREQLFHHASFWIGKWLLKPQPQVHEPWS